MWGKVRESGPDFSDADAGLKPGGVRAACLPKSDES